VSPRLIMFLLFSVLFLDIPVLMSLFLWQAFAHSLQAFAAARPLRP